MDLFRPMDEVSVVELTINIKDYRYDIKPLCIQAKTVFHNTVEKYMYVWLLDGYKPSVSDVSQMMTDLMHKCEWTLYERPYANFQLTPMERHWLDFEKEHWGKQSVVLSTPIEHGPAISEELLAEMMK
jgi:hypothetical protein